MTTDLETRIRAFLKEQKDGVFYDDDDSELEYIDFDNFANISMFLDTAIGLLEESIGEKK